MTVTLTVNHSFNCLVPDGENNGDVRPSDWNADHLVGGVTGLNSELAALTAGVAANAAALAAKADIVSPAFTGTPTAPTPAVDDNSVKVATTAYVIGQAGTLPPLMDSLATVGSSTRYSKQDHIHPSDTSRAAVTALQAWLSYTAGMINGTFQVSASASALTIAVKSLAGTDPTAADPVYVVFRSVTGSLGDYTTLTLTAATSLVVSSGSTLGVTSATAFRLWLVGFNDGSTFRLGVINCSTTGQIFNLHDGIYSATAEGGAGAADSAGVTYANATVNLKAMRVLGFAEWSTSGVTAGTWTTANLNLVQLHGPGLPLPGDVIQRVRTVNSAFASGVGVIPSTGVPQITNGTQFMTQAVTPVSAANLLVVEAQGLFAAPNNADLTAMALFQDATAAALATMACDNFTSGGRAVPRILHLMRAGTTISTTFRARAGATVSTTGFNGNSSVFYGSTLNSFMEVTELMG